MKPAVRHALAAVAALVGGNAVFALALGMNSAAPAPEPKDHGQVVEFTVAPQRAPPPESKSRPREQQARQPKATAPPAAMLGASLSGMSFGLSAFEEVDLTGQSGALLGGGQRDVVMSDSAVDQPPRPLQRADASYPERARAKGIEGFVTLSLLIGADGTVKDVQVLEAQPPSVFEAAGEQAVRAWRFEPAMYGGEPVAVRVQQTIRFSLE